MDKEIDAQKHLEEFLNIIAKMIVDDIWEKEINKQ